MLVSPTAQVKRESANVSAAVQEGINRQAKAVKRKVHLIAQSERDEAVSAAAAKRTAQRPGNRRETGKDGETSGTTPSPPPETHAGEDGDRSTGSFHYAASPTILLELT